jgi:hypothetical protein
MKLFLVIGLGIIASFGLTVLAEFLWLNSANNGIWHVWHVRPEFFCIPVIVGAGVGFAARSQAGLAAALSLAPWAVWLVVGVNTGHPTASRWAITIALVSVYFAVGVGAAVLVGRRVARFVAKGGQSPSQEHA